MARLVPAAAALAVAALLPGSASAARFAVGIEASASLARVAARLEAVTGGTVSKDLSALRALVVTAPSARGVASLPGVAYVERLDATRRRLSFAPNDPFAARQYYLQQIRAFDAWPQLPLLPGDGVRVAVIDSGIDIEHPEFAGRIALAKSFVGGSPRDRQGHGTFIAGVIAAAINDEQGIAGIGFPAQLLVAKVVRADGTISLEAEARAIRWAVDNGARVINLSLGGLRDPLDSKRDTYSPLEASAIEYAARRGRVVVAAVGNGDQAPRMPWTYASYPAALPHVVGVSAVTRDGSVPVFSNRDAIYNDVAAPGDDILSTLPRAVTARYPGCPEQGYSPCGPPEYRRAEGTSFAAPQVAAAAALLLSVRPRLRAEQVTSLLERSAADMTPATGCRTCPGSRDALTGWGRLDVTAAIQALATSTPASDRFEPNDDAGSRAATLRGARRQVQATIDFWDDQLDVYRIRLRPGQRISATVRGPGVAATKLQLWKPGTERVQRLALTIPRLRVAQSVRSGQTAYLRPYRARLGGWYFLEVRLPAPGWGRYTLSFAKR